MDAIRHSFVTSKIRNEIWGYSFMTSARRAGWGHKILGNFADSCG